MLKENITKKRPVNKLLEPKPEFNIRKNKKYQCKKR